MPRRWPLLLPTLLGLAVAGAGCQRGKARRGAADAGAGTDGALPLAADPAPPEPAAAGDQPLLAFEPGPYVGDERYAVLARGFDERVRRAGDRMDLATGLSFRDRAPPRVVLCPLGDETVPWRMEREIADGRRRAVLRVNIEPLVVGQGDPDRVLLHARAAAAVEGGDHGTRPPAWFTVYVGCLAAGDLADRLDRAARAAARAGRTLELDPGDPAKAEATAFGAGLLLAEKCTAPDLRRLVALVADGEDPTRLLPRWVHDDAGMWVGAAREILEDAASRADGSGDATVAAAGAALEALGPAGLEDFLATAEKAGHLTDEVRAEAELLRLAAALREGQEDEARKVLERAPPEARSSGGCETPAPTCCSRRGGTRCPAASRCARSRC